MIMSLISADQWLLRAGQYLAAGARAIDPEHALDEDAAEEFENAWASILRARQEIAVVLARLAPNYDPSKRLDEF